MHDCKKNLMIGADHKLCLVQGQMEKSRLQCLFQDRALDYSNLHITGAMDLLCDRHHQALPPLSFQRLSRVNCYNSLRLAGLLQLSQLLVLVSHPTAEFQASHLNLLMGTDYQLIAHTAHSISNFLELPHRDQSLGNRLHHMELPSADLQSQWHLVHTRNMARALLLCPLVQIHLLCHMELDLWLLDSIRGLLLHTHLKEVE
jgi:hypothetical protein